MAEGYIPRNQFPSKKSEIRRQIIIAYVMGNPVFNVLNLVVVDFIL